MVDSRASADLWPKTRLSEAGSAHSEEAQMAFRAETFLAIDQ